MKFVLVGEVHHPALGRFIQNWSSPLESHFEGRDYGSGLKFIGVVLMSRLIPLKRRIQYSRDDRQIYIDILLGSLSLKRMTELKIAEWPELKICEEIVPILRDKKVPDFDLARFEEDLRASFSTDRKDELAVPAEPLAFSLAELDKATVEYESEDGSAAVAKLEAVAGRSGKVTVMLWPISGQLPPPSARLRGFETLRLHPDQGRAKFLLGSPGHRVCRW